MFCKNCGTKYKDENKFCTSCGTIKPNETEALRQNDETPSTFNYDTSKPEKKKQKWRWLLAIIGVTLLIIIAVASVYLSKDKNVQTPNNSQSVVDINCDNGYGGSGTIFTSDGTILTNNHVITGAKSCEVTIPNPTTGGIYEIYQAAPVIVPTLSKEYDVATLKIDGSYTDKDGKTWGIYPTTFTPFSLPATCNVKIPSQLGDSVKIYGYPVTSGGFNLTLTTGVISSFANNADILTSAQIDSGNSGGLAIDQNGCWLGIPSAVLSGNYQNLGVIIPGSIVEQFLNNVPAKLDPATNISSTTEFKAESAAVPAETPDQQCQGEYGQYSGASGQTDKTGNPTCTCHSGYTWDETGDACASKTSLQQECKNNYGLGSYSYVEGGKSICGCSAGYVWNSDQSECVIEQESNNEICQNTYGINSQWTGQMGGNGSPQCNCQNGYSWDTTGDACADQTSLNQACKNNYGTGSYSYTESGKAVCGCSTGYNWNSDQTACVIAETGYQVCANSFTNETWDGTYSSDGKYNCVCQAGYTYNSDTQSCE